MAYELEEVLEMLKVYHEIESEAASFLSFSAFAMKHKELKIKSAERTLASIEKYKKLPIEVRKELEKNGNDPVSKIVELEKECRKGINN